MAEKCACGAGRCCSQHYAVEIRWSWNGANPRHVFSFECNLYDCLNFVSHWKYLQTSQISWWCLRRLVMQIYVGGIASRGITFYTTSYNKTKYLFYPIYFKLCSSNVFFLLFILLCVCCWDTAVSPLWDSKDKDKTQSDMDVTHLWRQNSVLIN